MVHYFTYSHSSPGHKFQHKPVTGIHSPENDLIDGLLIDNVPLNSLRTPKYLFYDRGIAGISEGGQAGIDAEIIKGCEYQVPVSFCCLFVVPGQRK